MSSSSMMSAPGTRLWPVRRSSSPMSQPRAAGLRAYASAPRAKPLRESSTVLTTSTGMSRVVAPFLRSARNFQVSSPSRSTSRTLGSGSSPEAAAGREPEGGAAQVAVVNGELARIVFHDEHRAPRALAHDQLVFLH